MKNITIHDSLFAHGTSLGSGDLKIHPKNFHWFRANAGSRYEFVTDSHFDKVNITDPSRAVAFIIEPRSIHPRAYEFVKNNQHKFAYILSHDKDFLSQIPNGLYYPFGGCWIRPEERKVYQKTKLISIIASAKTQTEGHRLRHEIIERYSMGFEIDVFGRGYNPVENKLDALKDYCYSIVIENEFSRGWFTEKLIDCLQTGTIPIYQGAPDIHDYFMKEKGFLNLKSIDQLLNYNKENPGAMFAFYKDSTNQIKRMFELSKRYVCPEDYMFETYPFLFV